MILRRQQLVSLAADACVSCRAVEPIRDQRRSRRPRGPRLGSRYRTGSSRRCASRPITPIPAICKRLDVEIMPPVPVEQVIATMSRAVFNPVLVRPIFHHLRLVNPRTVRDAGGEHHPAVRAGCRVRAARSTASGPESSSSTSTRPEQIADVLRRPEHYADIVREAFAAIWRRSTRIRRDFRS